MAAEIGILQYRVADFSRLQPGSLTLGVPVFNEALQIFSGPPQHKTDIEVAVGEDTVGIVRSDRQPIQIAWRERISESPRAYTGRIALIEPVSRLDFLQVDRSNMWRLDLHPEFIRDATGIELFTTLVGRYAVQHQRRSGSGQGYTGHR